MREHAEKKASGSRTGKRIAIASGGVIAALVAALAAFTFLGGDKIHAGVYAGGVSLGGMTEAEAAQALQQQVGPALQSARMELTIEGENYPIEIGAVTSGVDHAGTTQEAYRYTHEGNPFARMGRVLRALVAHHEVPLTVAVDHAALAARLDEISEQALKAPVDPSWTIEGDQLKIDKGEAGVDFDRAAVDELVTKRIAGMDFEPFEVETQSEAQAPVDLAAVKEAVDAEAKNATVDKADGKTILPSQDGIVMDLDAATRAMQASGAERVFTVTVERTMATVTAEQLAGVLFRDTLASMSSDFSSSSSARANNVQRAASNINGTILNPGDEFSYNGVVGERTGANGFKEAGAYVAGKLVDEVGGGVCQPSSTLYRAVLRADLKVTERTNHGLTVGHTPKGEDATVSWGSLDFRFVNSTPYPVKIIATSANRKLTMTIVGTKTSDKQVSIANKIIATYEPQTIEKKDSTLPVGTTKVDITPMTGYKVETYKTVTENGKSTTTKITTSTYKKRDKVVLVGTKPVDPAAAPTGGTVATGGGETSGGGTTAPTAPTDTQTPPADAPTPPPAAPEDPTADPE